MHIRCWSVAARVVPALLILCPFAHPAGNPFPKVAEINLNERLVALGEAPLESMTVWAVSFSPDNSRLAIEFGEPGDRVIVPGVEPRPTPNRYLLIVPVANPQDTTYWIKLGKLWSPLNGAGAAALAERPPFSELRWAPEGNALWYATNLIRFPGGDACRVPGGLLGFVGPATGLITVGHPPPAGAPRTQTITGGTGGWLTFDDKGRLTSSPTPPHITLGVIDFQCQILEKLTTDLPMMMAAVSSDPHFLTTEDINLMSGVGDLILARLAYSELASPGDPLRAMKAQPPGDGLPNRRLPIESRRRIHLAQHYVGNVVFLGGAVCSLLQEPVSRLPLHQPPPHSEFDRLQAKLPGPNAGDRNIGMQLSCWDTETGKRIRESKALWSRSALPMSTGGGRVAIGDDGWPAWDGEQAAPRFHSIWDFKTGQVMAGWSPEFSMGPGTELGARVGFAISSDGRLIAEGGPGFVRVYRLP